MRMMAWGLPMPRGRRGGMGPGGPGIPGGAGDWSGSRFPGGRGPWSPWRRIVVLISVLLLVGVVTVFVTDAVLRPPMQAWASSRAVNVAQRGPSPPRCVTTCCRIWTATPCLRR